VSDIAAEFPTIGRAAVSKHLGILRRAKLVRSRKRGREQYYELNPQPLVDVYGDWVRKFEEVAEASLQKLKERVESDPE
jgi:DNA-binding transcriptional ArsR family regulator